MKDLVSKNALVALLLMARRGIPLLAILFAMTGCETSSDFSEQPTHPSRTPSEQTLQQPLKTAEPAQSEPLTLRDGDVVSVSFPGSSSLNTTQQIRRDGKIVLPLVGEVTAAGKTPDHLQNELLKLYAPQVDMKQVIVTVQSSTFPVFVTGAVLRPGKVLTDHPLTALDAIMEAGGFDFTRANLKAVVVIRQEKNGTRRYVLNLQTAMKGGPGEPFYLKPSDIIYVPEKFNWF